MHWQTGKNAYKGAGEKGRSGEREIKRVTKAAPIVLSAPFLEDLLRFCRNPIALSAIKPESCPVKGWYGGRRARTESVTIGEERERSLLLAGAWRKGGGKVQRGSGKGRKRRTSVCARYVEPCDRHLAKNIIRVC